MTRKEEKQQEKRGAYKALQNMVFNRNMTETVKRAIRVRLQVILDEEERQYEKWKLLIKDTLSTTRRRQVEREFKKRIQAYKITIFSLTPFTDRAAAEVPSFVVKKEKKKPLLLTNSIPIQANLIPEKVKKSIY